jgi:hypothetical protein
MLRKIYRAIVLAQAASAANKTLATMSDRILDYIGQSRDSFAKNTAPQLHINSRNMKLFFCLLHQKVMQG